MLSIPHTLSLHRATRDLYMRTARRARDDAWECKIELNRLWHFPRESYNEYLAEAYYRGVKYGRGAMRCFLRHARAANRKLVAVKRLERQMIMAPYIGTGSDPWVGC